MLQAEFYTYIHRTADTGRIFYAGKGKGSRATFRYQRSSHWSRVAKKHGFTVEYIAYFYDEADALMHEIDLIAELIANGNKLVNHTAGGEGTSGYKHTEAAKEEMRAAAIGRKLSQQAKEKISAIHKGRQFSDEHRKNLAIANKLRFSDPEQLIKAREVQIGKHAQSEELREKIRQSKIRNKSGVGRVHSEETKRKIRESNIATAKAKREASHAQAA